MIVLHDFHITNPLFQNKTGQVHGWEIDGAVSIEKNVLEFGLNKKGEYIIKSFIPVISPKVVNEISIDI